MNYPIRTDIEVLPADPPKKWYNQVRINSRGKCSKGFKLGWVVRETIGVAVINSRAFKHIKGSYVIGDEIKCQDVDTIKEISNNSQKSASIADTTFMKLMKNMRLRLEKISTRFKTRLEKSASNLWKR